jgi:hypothetical protein
MQAPACIRLGRIDKDLADDLGCLLDHRLVGPFQLATWEELLRQVRAAEAVDPEGRQWPRTKRSDDATAVYVALDEATNPQP